MSGTSTSDIVVGCLIIVTGLATAAWCGYHCWKSIYGTKG